MFIDTQLDLIPAPEEPNVAAVVNMALRWSAKSVEPAAINIWPRRGQTHRNQHTTQLYGGHGEPPLQLCACLLDFRQHHVDLVD
jgi:hypothetical protein